LGVVSFLLVVYYGSVYVVDSGFLTIYRNRVGDVFFLFSFSWFFFSGYFGFDGVGGFSDLIFWVLFFSGFITKRAQVPFSAWLPAAIAAPTPVSSLVHSSTLVTAGVYMFVRYNFVFFSRFFFFVVSLCTMFVGGLGAFFEMDFKKVVAMSTLSQLGFMMVMCSLGFWGLCFFHLVIHAIFKSLLFISCGSLMVFVYGSQDFRFFGGVCGSFSSVVFFLSVFCLSGVPFLVGFFSKDFFFSRFVSLYEHGLFLYFFFFFSCVFTIGYSFRLVFGSFFYSFGSFSVSGFVGDVVFFFSVIFLYFIGVFSGAVFFFFIGDCCAFFSYGFDYMRGLLLLLSIFVVFLSFFVRFLFSIGWLWFLSFGGFSQFLGFSVFSSFVESSWLEFFGGKGLYSRMFSVGYFSAFFFYVGFLGFVFFYMFFIFF
jgi:NADH-ubiquinone oxidoreductase chain 5